MIIRMNTPNQDNHDAAYDGEWSAEAADELGRQLAELPGTVPPRVVWDRIEAQAEAEGLFTPRTRPSAGLRWLLGSGVAAAVALVVLNMPMAQRLPAESPATVERLPTVPAFDAQALDPNRPGQAQAQVRALMVESQLLEQDLRRLPSQPAVARAATLATIDELQTQIASIDQRLIDPALPAADQARFWRERVRLMDSLLQLRYAQAQRLSF